MTDDETIAAFRRYRETGDRRVRNAIVEEHRWIATTGARRFRDRGESSEDLAQVGLLGLLKAVERFEPDHGTPFPGFAWPTVMGELRRHFRDATWSVHVPRRMKEISASLTPAAEGLRERLGRHPTVDELAVELRVSVEDVIGGMEASAAYRASSLQGAGTTAQPVVRERGEDDAQLALTETRMAIEGMLSSLPERERTILFLRFFEEKTQSEIAALVGTSQVHVSRLIKASLATLRGHDDEDHSTKEPDGGDHP